MTTQPVKSQHTDRRVRRTQKALEDALVSLILEKGYEAVTVQDISERANVGRSTFYAYYDYKDELLLSQLDKLDGAFSDAVVHSLFKDGDSHGALALFQNVQANRQVVKAMLGRQSGALIADHLYGRLRPRVEAHMLSQLTGAQAASIPVDLIAHHVVCSLLTMIGAWLDSKSPLPPEQMDDLFRVTVMTGVKMALRL
jgi:AcrR family transcriptional regulator